MDYVQDIDPFTTTFRREILFYLRQLIADSELVTVVFDDGNEAFLTMLLEVDEEDDVVVFDWGGSDASNLKLLKQASAYFVANPVGVRNQFITHRIWETTYKSRRAFATRIPEKFVRLQRREYYRLNLTINQRIPCSLILGTPPGRTEMSIVDMGVGGIGLVCPSTDISVAIGQVFANVAINLGKIGSINTSIEVRHSEMVLHGAKQVLRIGCQFNDLSPANEHLLQRFITKIQLEERR